MKRVFVLVGLAAVAMLVTDAEAFRVTTADTGGADVELREESPTSNRGTNTEIASRVSAKSLGASYDHQALIYLKFGVAGITTADLLGDITVRTTYRNTNLAPSRYQDMTDPIGPNTGWDYYLLDPTTAGANWDELAITPSTAPGCYVDGDYTTKPIYDFLGDLNPGLNYLGRQLYDDDDLRGGHLSVGGAFDFTLGAGSLLHQMIEAAQGTDHQTLTIVMVIAHEADNDNTTQWINFNYLFNPKEMDPLNADATSPWGGMSNANDDFSPMLTNEPHIPEPATMALLALGGLLLGKKR
ncbi:MAG: PEP-CTERM sorting domain-containing protein [Sedimentisphaerales bacterium]|nr:PEP-CTERM sorting domain-containing protein [Sedimentisphaerales bacterium]